VTSKRSGPASRISPVRGRLSLTLVVVAGAGLSLGLTGCGSPGPSRSYQQGWDRAVTSPGHDCGTVPSGIASHADWTRDCSTAENYLGIHDTTGHGPTPTPTTYAGDP
jgi:hypothetical protein